MSHAAPSERLIDAGVSFKTYVLVHPTFTSRCNISRSFDCNLCTYIINRVLTSYKYL